MDKAKIEKILSDFSECINAEITTVEVNGIKRKPTLQDKIDLILGSWEKASEELYELGIDTKY